MLCGILDLIWRYKLPSQNRDTMKEMFNDKDFKFVLSSIVGLILCVSSAVNLEVLIAIISGVSLILESDNVDKF